MGTFVSFSEEICADTVSAGRVEEKILDGISRKRNIRHGRTIFLAAHRSLASSNRELSIVNGIDVIANPVIWEVYL